MGIIHCDISPDNLIFDKENNLKLIDFGAAKLGEQQREEQKETYYKGSYTPPEQYYDVKKLVRGQTFMPSVQSGMKCLLAIKFHQPSNEHKKTN